MKLVQTQAHEFDATYIFDGGLTPYFGVDQAVKNGGGSQDGHFETDDGVWAATLYYQNDTGLINPGATTHTGTRFDLDTIREFRLKVKKSGDEVGQKSFSAHITPRWQGMQAEKSDGTKTEISIPDGIEEAVNVRIQGSNIAFHKYEQLLRDAFATLGVRGSHFTEPHEHSSVSDAETYVRIHKDASGPIHGRAGPLASLGHLLENDREGYRKVVQNENDEKGRNVEGYYHTTTLGQKRIREAFPNHELPKEIKHYYAREAASKDPTKDPLAHPKLGASYQVNRWDDKLGVDELGKLRKELDQTVYSVLAEAEVSLFQTDDGPYVEDAYFGAENVEIPEDDNPVISLDLTKIKHDQKNIVIKHLSDGLNPVQRESIETLITDGGHVAPKDIAERHGRHPDSVRRALREIDQLVDRAYGEVSLRSPNVAEMLHTAIEEANNAFERAAESVSKALETTRRGLDEKVSALVAWGANHGIDIRDADDDLQVSFGTVEGDDGEKAIDKIRRQLRNGKQAWVRAGRDPQLFDTGEWRATIIVDDAPRARTYSLERTQNVGGGIGGTI